MPEVPHRLKRPISLGAVNDGLHTPVQQLPRHLVLLQDLPGSGKSTIAHMVEEKLHGMGCRTYVLDGDHVRHGLCSDLGFSNEDRSENIRRIGEVVKLFIDAGVIVLTAFISPFRVDRQKVRLLLNGGDFIEIYCKCPIEVCERRVVKGHYRAARVGKIEQFTGISSPYEPPENAELVLDTNMLPLDKCVETIVNLLKERGIVSAVAKPRIT